MVEFIFAIAIIMIYFAPALVAYNKKKRNAGAILTLNFFLGWTMIGWIVALVWASTYEKN